MSLAESATLAGWLRAKRLSPGQIAPLTGHAQLRARSHADLISSARTVRDCASGRDRHWSAKRAGQTYAVDYIRQQVIAAVG